MNGTLYFKLCAILIQWGLFFHNWKEVGNVILSLYEKCWKFEIPCQKFLLQLLWQERLSKWELTDVLIDNWFVCLMVVSFIYGGKAGPRENHWPVASRWQTLSYNVVHLTLIEWVSDCCLMPIQQFSSYIMPIIMASSFSMMRSALY
jgi:hypothetical protein